MTLRRRLLQMWRPGLYIKPAYSEPHPLQLFDAGEPGLWYEPADLSTLFQDSAGTVPVTAMEQRVWRVLDKSGRGNHCISPSATQRPVVSRRVNLIGMDSSTFAGCGLLKSGTGVLPVVTPNYSSAPDGTQTAVRIQLDSGGGVTNVDYSIVSAALYAGKTQIAGAAYKTKIWMRATSGAATVTLTGAGSNVSLQALTTAWRLVEIPEVGIGGVGFALRLSSNGGYAASRGPQDVLVWHPQLTFAFDDALPYQRVTSDTDYDAAPEKFPTYLLSDGVTGAMSTVGNVNLTAASKLFVCAGVTALGMGDAGIQQIVGSNGSGLNGFGLWAPNGSGKVVFATAGATGLAQTVESGLGSAPRSMVLAGLADQAGPSQALWRDGVQRAAGSAVTGGGGFGNRPTELFNAAGQRFFSGRLYSLIVRGAQTSASQIADAQAYTAKRMGRTL